MMMCLVEEEGGEGREYSIVVKTLGWLGGFILTII